MSGKDTGPYALVPKAGIYYRSNPEASIFLGHHFAGRTVQSKGYPASAEILLRRCHWLFQTLSQSIRPDTAGVGSERKGCVLCINTRSNSGRVERLEEPRVTVATFSHIRYLLAG